jgi:hypothetical protein
MTTEVDVLLSDAGFFDDSDTTYAILRHFPLLQRMDASSMRWRQDVALRGLLALPDSETAMESAQ